MATRGLEAVCADAQEALPEDCEIRISLGRGRVDVTVWDAISGECIAWQPRDGTRLELQVAEALKHAEAEFIGLTHNASVRGDP